MPYKDPEKRRQHSAQRYLRIADILKPKRRQRYLDNIDIVKQQGRNTHHSMKLSVFTHYGLKCELCNECRLGALNIDHVLGNGKKHRKQLGITGSGFHMWLYQQHEKTGIWLPDYRTLCANHNYKEYLMTRSLSMKKENIHKREQASKIKLETINILGGAFCEECGCNDIEMLDIHHPDHNGAEHRRELNVNGSTKFYRILLKSGDFTTYRLSITCRSCNSNAEYRKNMYLYQSRVFDVFLDIAEDFRQDFNYSNII